MEKLYFYNEHEHEYNIKYHPEKLPGEMWLTNYSKDGDFFEKCCYKTKRKGKIAYDCEGKVVYGSFPVFIKEYEFLKI